MEATGKFNNFMNFILSNNKVRKVQADNKVQKSSNVTTMVMDVERISGVSGSQKSWPRHRLSRVVCATEMRRSSFRSRGRSGHCWPVDGRSRSRWPVWRCNTWPMSSLTCNISAVVDVPATPSAIFRDLRIPRGQITSCVAAAAAKLIPKSDVRVWSATVSGDVEIVLATVLDSAVRRRQRSRQRSAKATRSVAYKSQIPLRCLVRSWFEAGRRPAASWNLAYHLACWQRTSTS